MAATRPPGGKNRSGEIVELWESRWAPQGFRLTSQRQTCFGNKPLRVKKPYRVTCVINALSKYLQGNNTRMGILTHSSCTRAVFSLTLSLCNNSSSSNVPRHPIPLPFEDLIRENVRTSRLLTRKLGLLFLVGRNFLESPAPRSCFRKVPLGLVGLRRHTCSQDVTR